MATNNMHNLTTLIKRLEAATSRLEDIATTSTTPENSAPHPSAATTNGLATRSQELLNTPNAASRTTSTPSISLPKSETLPSEIEDYDTLIHGDLAAFIKLSDALDPLIAEQAKSLNAAFEAQREFLLVSTKAKKPDMASDEYMDILKDTQDKMMAVINIRLDNRASPLIDNLAMVADSAETLGWVTLDEKPADYVAELFGGAQMYGNKVLRQYKDKHEGQTEWVKAFYKLMRSLIAYTKQHYAKGLQWNPKGVSAAEALRQVKASANGVSPTPSAGGAPPPPPPMPAHLGGASPSPSGQAKAPASDMGAVFQQLNQGSAVTSGLKKVDPSQMTHKNPNLRTNVPIPTRSDSQSSGKSAGPPGKKPKPESMRVKRPPKKELDGNKWLIENYDSPSSPVEIEAEINHFILITRCKNTTIRVKGKANAISIDSSEKTSIVIDSLISSVDVIKCPSFALQVLGTLPTVLLDQVDGATVYLSKDSQDTEFLTSKCTAVNIYLPPVKEDDDYKECNVPEQLRSIIKDGKLVTEIVEHSG